LTRDTQLSQLRNKERGGEHFQVSLIEITAPISMYMLYINLTNTNEKPVFEKGLHIIPLSQNRSRERGGRGEGGWRGEGRR